MMKPRFALFLTLALTTRAHGLRAVDAPSNTPLGYWKTIDDHTGRARSIVKIFEVNGELRGRLEKLFDVPPGTKPPTCDKCPGNARGRPVLGLEFLWGFKREGASYSDGSVLDPEDGRVYHANLEVLDGGKHLKLFGYVRVLFKIGRSQTWTRVASPS